MGFGAGCFSKTLEPDQKVIVKNSLFTIEGEKEYTLTSNAVWLNITKNATGLAIQSAVDIEATIDVAGLAPGTYTATVTASGTGEGPAFMDASFCVNIEVVPEGTAESRVLVNAGGTGYIDSGGRIWGADAYFSDGVTSSKSFDVAGTTDDPLYLQYRYASSGAPFSYNIPVSEAGSYTLKLHFMEPYFKKSGARVFHVDVEGQRVLSNYDLYAQQGFGKAVVLTYEGVSVTDVTLSILFTSAINNAVVSAIEVAKAPVAPTYTLAAPLNKSLAIYPNPSTGDRLYVEVTGFTEHEALSLSIYDVTGRMVHAATTVTDKMGSSHEELLLNDNLRQGVYFIRAQGLSGWRQSRLVVQ